MSTIAPMLDVTVASPISRARQAMELASTPAESRGVEALAQAAKAYAKERGDYEMMVEAGRVYMLARIKTTELAMPHIRQGQFGREGNADVTFLSDFNFTKMQWQRRRDELDAAARLDDYIDDCILNSATPTPTGLVRFLQVGPAGNGVHVANNSGNNEWYTPAVYIEAARRVLGGIDLDPASSEVANRTVKARKFYTAQDDGLTKDWRGRVWMNPPYASELIGAFVSKLAVHAAAGEVTAACVLVNNATETGWFSELIAPASAVCFIRGRVKYLDETGKPKNTPLQGQAVVYIGGDVDRFSEEFFTLGWMARL